MESLKVLCLNCQKGYHPHIQTYLHNTLKSGIYDFLLLQEADEKVLSAEIKSVQNYNFLHTTNQDVNKQSHLCIVYKNNFISTSCQFLSFAKLNRRFSQRAELGFLIGIFSKGVEKIILGSLHLHPGFSTRIRIKEIRMIKNQILDYNKEGLPVIIGGDFNCASPGERVFARRIFKPLLNDATFKSGPTLNSKFTERGTHFVSKIGNILGKVGIRLLFKADRIFIDQTTSKKSKITTTILPDRVSDHSPVELTLS